MSRKLTDDDGVDAPFDRAMSRAIRADHTRTFSPPGHSHWRITLQYEPATDDYSFLATNLRTNKSAKVMPFPSMAVARREAVQYVESKEEEARKNSLQEAVAS